jgi:hypothetical protein
MTRYAPVQINEMMILHPFCYCEVGSTPYNIEPNAEIIKPTGPPQINLQRINRHRSADSTLLHYWRYCAGHRTAQYFCAIHRAAHGDIFHFDDRDFHQRNSTGHCHTG